MFYDPIYIHKFIGLCYFSCYADSWLNLITIFLTSILQLFSNNNLFIIHNLNNNISSHLLFDLNTISFDVSNPSPGLQKSLLISLIENTNYSNSVTKPNVITTLLMLQPSNEIKLNLSEVFAAFCLVRWRCCLKIWLVSDLLSYSLSITLSPYIIYIYMAQTPLGGQIHLKNGIFPEFYSKECPK